MSMVKIDTRRYTCDKCAVSTVVNACRVGCPTGWTNIMPTSTPGVSYDLCQACTGDVVRFIKGGSSGLMEGHTMADFIYRNKGARWFSPMIDLIAYATESENKDLRFWQLIYSWLKVTSISLKFGNPWSNTPVDPFYWEGKDK